MSARQIPWARVFVEGVVIVGSILLVSACGENDPTALELRPTDQCARQATDAAATFDDPNLDAAVRLALGLNAEDQVLCSALPNLTSLRADSTGISSLVGIQNLSSLTELWLRSNSISDLGPLADLTGLTELRLGFNPTPDISPLSGLTNLTWLGIGLNTISDIAPVSGLTSLAVLNLCCNTITDISALSGLTSLDRVRLAYNSGLTDIQPLLDNTGFGSGDSVDLTGTGVGCADVSALEAKGVAVTSDCP